MKNSNSPGVWYWTIPDSLSEIVLFPTREQVDSAKRQEAIGASSAELYECPNCARLIWDRGEDRPLATYAQDTRPPRVWVDFSDRDALGHVRIRHTRTMDEIRYQRLWLDAPGLRLIAYNGQVERFGHVELGLDDDGELDEGSRVVVLDE